MFLLFFITLSIVILFPVFGLVTYNKISQFPGFFNVLIDSLKNQGLLRYFVFFRAVYIYYFFILDTFWVNVTIVFSMVISIFGIALKFDVLLSFFGGSSLLFSKPLLLLFSFFLVINFIFRLVVNWSLLINAKLYANNRYDLLDFLDQSLVKTKFNPYLFVGRYVGQQNVTLFVPGGRPPISNWSKSGVIIGGLAATASVGTGYYAYKSFKLSELQYFEKMRENDIRQNELTVKQNEIAVKQNEIAVKQNEIAAINKQTDLKQVEMGMKTKKWFQDKYKDKE